MIPTHDQVVVLHVPPPVITSHPTHSIEIHGHVSTSAHHDINGSYTYHSDNGSMMIGGGLDSVTGGHIEVGGEINF
jgi:hypothetical protein